MIKTKFPMPEQSPKERRKNFSEVTLGLTNEFAIKEAERCLNCKTRPCTKGCPVGVHIPEFISLMKNGEFEKAYQEIVLTNSLPAVCGRVCPQESQCEKYCVHAIKGESVAIGRLERFCADYHMSNRDDNLQLPEKLGKKVAVVGSGPAGLSAAFDLAKLGYDVTVFEALHAAGGVLVYGIPEFRLPKEIVKKEITKLEKLGVEIKLNSVVGRLYGIEELKEQGFEAIFIGSGAGLPSFLGIPGENLNGVYAANEFLTRINLMKAYKFPESDTPIFVGENVTVVGGGNVAMDAARSAIRLGAKKVTIVYRRGEEELPARLEEIHHAKEEGVEFLFHTNPVAIIGNEKGWVNSMTCVKMGLGEPDEEGRRRPFELTNSEHSVPTDTVVIAIGQSPNPMLSNATKGLLTNKRGCIIVNEKTGETSIPGVFAGGDIVTGAATVILAMGAGKDAAAAIHEYLGGRS